jgi:hypothetical protein
MKVPALAARPPLGDTKPTTGNGAERMSWTMSRIAVSSPPGVSMRRMTNAVPDSCAFASARCT